jgi:uncharacterized membrane protein YphA (DoxX/SURF4 family)
MQFMEKLTPLTLLLLRIGVGIVFMYCGYHKFFGRRLEYIGEAVALWRNEKILRHPPAVDIYGLGLVLGAAAFTLAAFGVGSISLDRTLFGKGRSSRPAKS